MIKRIPKAQHELYAKAGLKWCPACATVKPHSEYYKAKKGKVPAYCRACQKITFRKPHMRFSHQKCMSKRRGIDWGLTLEEFSELIKKPCSYCSGPLPKTGGGLDRLDNSEGYTPKNSVPCCAICNWVRFKIFSPTEMLIIGRAIAEVRKFRGLGPDDELQSMNQMKMQTREYRPRKSKAQKIVEMLS